MNYPRVALVASPDPDAVMRCDLNDGTSWPTHEAFTLGAPPLLGDPGGPGADYGFRTLAFTLVIEEGEAQALRKQTELNQQLLRDENYLLFQFSAATPPVWFRCVRSSPGELSLATVFQDQRTNRWRVAVSLMAYPFAVGEPITHEVTVTNDPGDDNGLAVVLPDIVGDAPAPLLIDGVDQDDDGLLHLPLVAVTPLSSWPGLQRFKPAFSDAAWAMNTEAVSLADTEASGGQTVKSLVSNAVTLSISGAVTPAQAGTYRLFARLRGTTLDTTVTFGGTAAQAITTATGLVLSHYVYLDMGLYTFPKGNAPLEAGYTLASAGDTAHPEVSITASLPSGFTTVYVDEIVAVPCDLFEAEAPSRMLILTRSRLLGNRIDGEKRRVGPVPGTALQPATQEIPVGGYPMVVPASTNVLHFLTKVYTDTTITAFNPAETFGATGTLRLSYRPRWMNLASS